MAKKLIKKQIGGTYVTSKSGRVGRTHGLHGPYESIDTTGYGKNKKEFELKTSYSGYKPTSKKIKREDVPSVIKELQKGATKNLKVNKSGGAVKSKTKK